MAVVRHRSMEPTLYDGDRLLVSYRRTPEPGDVVVARFPDGTLVVKRVHDRVDDGWWLLSDNPEAGVDSRQVGAVRVVLAVAVARLWPHPRIVRRGDFSAT